MTTQTLLVGNWKMNLTPSESASFACKLREQLPTLSKTAVWVAPMTISLADVARELRGSQVVVGAQNAHWAPSGAFTGETSPAALKDLGLRFSILGHSERRTLFGESSESVALRMKALLAERLTPVVCIGETLEQRGSSLTEQVLESQLGPIFTALDAHAAEQTVLAYEPVWAIGTGKVASEKEIAETHAFIRALWDSQGYNSAPRILYGGSVNPQNFGSIVKIPNVSGALVGGASIKLEQWLELIAIAERA
jgi:triosephosphate isomerase